jgi:AraC-like DNA-binding protein/ligand-binding sensor protein
MSKSVQFIFAEDAKRIFDCFTQIFGIRIVFFSYDGRELNAGSDLPRCRYCNMLRESFGFEKKCHTLDLKQQILSDKRRKLIAYECHGNMTEAVLPVYVVKKLIGYIMIGQFRTSDKFIWPLDIPSKSKKDLNCLRKAYFETPYYSKQMVENILKLFSLQVEFIVNRHLINIRNETSISKLIAYIDEHPEEAFSLEEAANLIFSSVSTVSHLFKKATGMGFKKYQITKKLQKAEELLLSNPENNIALVSKQVGISDPLYFSRLYKKHRGYAPKKHNRNRKPS